MADRPKTLNFITGNANKLAEVRAILGNAVDLQSRNVDIDEIQGTIEEIARDKCRRAAEKVSSAYDNPETKVDRFGPPSPRSIKAGPTW
jgi:inosine triphosphate pyrophosphatase